MTTKAQLETRIAQLEAMLQVAQDGLIGLLDYAAHPKYQQGPGMATQDVVLRVNAVRSAIADVEVEPWGWAHPIGGVGCRGAWDASKGGHTWGCADEYQRLENETKYQKAQRRRELDTRLAGLAGLKWEVA